MQTLEELKDENAKTETKTDEANPAELELTEAEAATPQVEEVDEVEEQAGEPTEADSNENTDGDVEPWMQEEGQTSEDDEQRTIPLAAHLKARNKIKARLGEREEENTALRDELNALKSQIENMQPTQARQQGKATPMPREYDFSEDAEYQNAMTQWVQEQVQNGVATVNQTASQSAQQAQAKQKLEQSIDGHYQRAEALVKQANIDIKAYEAAELSVRQDIESVLPNAGNVVVDELISRLGDGSEKVMYYLGRNSSARLKMIDKLKSDPSGISAAMYLADIKATRATPKKLVSRAPKPATVISGDASGGLSGDAKALLKKYKQAHNTGSIQAAYNAKKQARAAGIDTSQW